MLPGAGATFVDINTIRFRRSKRRNFKVGHFGRVRGGRRDGVVNIHLWKDFRGAQLSQYGNTIQGRRRSLVDILFGVVMTRCPLPVTSFTFTITPPLTGTMPTLYAISGLQFGPWNFNVSKISAAAVPQ